MKCITKKEKLAYENVLMGFFKELGADPNRTETGTIAVSAEFPTVYGPLLVHWFDGDGSVYSMACRFTDKGQREGAKCVHGQDVNPFNGKWCHHLGGSWGGVKAAKHMIAALTGVGIEELPIKN